MLQLNTARNEAAKEDTALEIFPSHFEEVRPLWERHLWPGRRSPIEPTNPICLDGSYLDGYQELQRAYFWIYAGQQGVCGAISLLHVRSREYRVRGLIVLPNQLGRGGGRNLIETAIGKARELNAEEVWTLPRKGAFPFYSKMGFKMVSDWIEDKFEFGPNCFAVYSNL